VSAKHGRNRLSNYVEIHATVMSRFVDENFVLVDGLAIDPLGNGQIWIHGHIKCAGGVEITVDDDGPGIAPERYEEAFKPFNRLDESRNQNEKGVGLGLAIARDVARGLGGDVVLDRGPMGGLRAVVRLPG